MIPNLSPPCQESVQPKMVPRGSATIYSCVITNAGNYPLVHRWLAEDDREAGALADEKRAAAGAAREKRVTRIGAGLRL